jgi:uncharacterized protein YodC (DUF2158 family)
MEEIKIGDIVRLKSGSPHMTVTDVEDGGISIAVIYWHEKLCEFKRINFESGLLEKIEQSE